MFFKIAETLTTIDYTHFTYFLLLFKGGGIKKIKKEYSKEKTQKSVYFVYICKNDERLP